MKVKRSDEGKKPIYQIHKRISVENSINLLVRLKNFNGESISTLYPEIPSMRVEEKKKKKKTPKWISVHGSRFTLNVPSSSFHLRFSFLFVPDKRNKSHSTSKPKKINLLSCNLTSICYQCSRSFLHFQPLSFRSF